LTITVRHRLSDNNRDTASNMCDFSVGGRKIAEERSAATVPVPKSCHEVRLGDGNMRSRRNDVSVNNRVEDVGFGLPSKRNSLLHDTNRIREDSNSKMETWLCCGTPSNVDGFHLSSTLV